MHGSPKRSPFIPREKRLTVREVTPKRKRQKPPNVVVTLLSYCLFGYSLFAVVNLFLNR